MNNVRAEADLSLDRPAENQHGGEMLQWHQVLKEALQQRVRA